MDMCGCCIIWDTALEQAVREAVPAALFDFPQVARQASMGVAWLVEGCVAALAVLQGWEGC